MHRIYFDAMSVELLYMYVIGSYGGSSVFGMLVCWGIDDIMYLDLFPLLYGLCIYTLPYEL